jgi:hypothetical protein
MLGVFSKTRPNQHSQNIQMLPGPPPQRTEPKKEKRTIESTAESTSRSIWDRIKVSRFTTLGSVRILDRRCYVLPSASSAIVFVRRG